MHASTLDQLPADILVRILDLAMVRDSPCYIDDPRPGPDRCRTVLRIPAHSGCLESSTGAKDPHFTGYQGTSPLHHRALQSFHKMDWIAINSTSRIIRLLGKVSFFKVKTFAMHEQLPARLKRNDPDGIKGMTPDDQALALSYIHEIVIVNTKDSNAISFLLLPRTLAAFPCLRRCTLLFGFATPDRGPLIYEGNEGRIEVDDVEWITTAFALGEPVPLKMQEHMAAMGMPINFRLEEAMGPRSTWEVHRNALEKYVYAALQVRAKLLLANEERATALHDEVEAR
jgi:hypothetical protein